MWNIDLTRLIGRPKGYEEENFYVFNPSIIKLPNSENLFLISYRVCFYDVSVHLHPWKIWDNGYKYFSDPRAVVSLKYRNELGKSFNRLFNTDFYEKPPAEYDSTGLAILIFENNKFSVVSNIYHLFDREMNQDSRLSIINGEIYISYNVFEKYETELRASMRYRILKLDEEMNSISLSDEQLMFTHRYQNFEKNCVFFHKGIIYRFGKYFEYIINDQLIRKLTPFSKLIDYYGEKYVISSSSTPIIRYDDKWLGCAHVAVLYKKLRNIMPFKKFFDAVNIENVSHHGKYIYFAAFYEFDDEMQITRVSNPFIPTYFSDHMPYLICMPTGLVWFDDKILLSYGEGDCRCKFVIFRKEEMERILLSEPDCGFYLLSQRFELRHFGYYNVFNAGDEAFRKVFIYLRNKHYPMSNLRFSTPYSAKLNMPTIFGGGDIINSHFLTDIPDRSAAVGVGIPYAEFEPLVNKFQSVILRNKSDAKRLNLLYAPDLAFLLPKIYNVSVNRIPKLIGISALRTYFNKESTKPYNDYIKNMSVFIKALIKNGFKIILIPFCINKNQPEENDLITCDEISRLVQHVNCIVFRPSEEHQVYETYEQIAKLDFMICARFHSHIFCVANAIPFISLTCGRKCIEFMQQEDLSRHLFKLKVVHFDLPAAINVEALLDFFNIKYSNRQSLHIKLRKIRKNIFNQMKSFEEAYVSIVKELVGKGEICLYPEVDDKFGKELSQFLTDRHNKNELTCHSAAKPGRELSNHLPTIKLPPPLVDCSIPEPTTPKIHNESPDIQLQPKYIQPQPITPAVQTQPIASVVQTQPQYVQTQPITSVVQTQPITSVVQTQPQYVQSQPTVQTQPITTVIQPQPQYAQAQVQTQPITTVIQPQPQYVQAQVQTQPITTVIQSQPQYVQAQVQTQPITTVIQPQPQYVQAQVQTQPITTVIQPQPQYVQAQVQTQPITTVIQPQPQYVQTQPITAVIQPQPQYVQAQPMTPVIQSQPQYVQAQPMTSVIQSQPQYVVQSQPMTLVQSQPQYVQTQPITSIVQSQPQYVQSQPIASVVQAQPQYVQSQPATTVQYVQSQPMTSIVQTQPQNVQSQSLTSIVQTQPPYYQSQPIVQYQPIIQSQSQCNASLCQSEAEIYGSMSNLL